ncbi:MAG: lysozyme inhibitor LprI family protein [Gemmatimonadaceae bacterium]
MTDTMTTPTMRRELSNDLRVAEQALQEIQDSVDAALGPDLAIRLLPLRDAFVTYKNQQCASLKAVFRDGTFGPVAELECQIHLTDSRREFIEEHYDFIERIGELRRRAGRANASHRAARTP